MTRVRRTAFLFVHGEGDPPLVTSALTGETAALERSQLEVLFSVSGTQWADVEPGRSVEELCARGLLVSENEPVLLARDEQLAADGWLPAAACFHFSTRLREVGAGADQDLVRVAAEADAEVGRFVERHGPPPPHFPARGGERVELPLERRSGDLSAALGDRRTTRGYSDRPITLDQLSLLLYEVFGCRATLALHPEVVALRKSSPSAGGLHPIEAYPLVRSVEGVEPGFYHYAVGDHALERIASVEDGQVTRVTAGQPWFEPAAVAVVLTARFRRTFWKYRQSPTAYATLLLDAGHLSQTWYLICAQLGLGAFVTNVIDSGATAELIGVDEREEGALAVLGCGVRSAERSPLEPEFTPYIPR